MVASSPLLYRAQPAQATDAKLTSEGQLRTQLDLPRAAALAAGQLVGKAGDQSEVRAGVVRIRLAPLWRVDHAECLGAELEVPALVNFEIAEQGRIQVPVSGPVDHVRAKIAELQRIGWCETVRGDCRTAFRVVKPGTAETISVENMDWPKMIHRILIARRFETCGAVGERDGPAIVAQGGATGDLQNSIYLPAAQNPGGRPGLEMLLALPKRKFVHIALHEEVLPIEVQPLPVSPGIDKELEERIF